MAEPRDIAALRTAILRTLAYADVFDYPLTGREIHRYLIGRRAEVELVQCCLDEIMSPRREISRANGFYTLPGRQNLRRVRERRQKTAAKLWPAAARFSRHIGRLPFVRMVAATGSLAVDNVEDEADIDFLIVTAPDRLWLCRALVIGVVRFAAMRGLRLCPNFLLSENALLYPQPALYPAHELAQMVPLSGFDTYRNFRHINGWTQRFLPNALGPPANSHHSLAYRMPTPKGLQRTAEKVLISPSFGKLESWEMRRKIHRFADQYPDSDESQFNADCCKGHFDGHARRTLARYRARLHSLGLEDNLPDE